MQHLTPEDLARCVDEAPSEYEAAHIAGCSRCADELEAMREQTGMLGDLPRLSPPDAQWARIRSRAESEGLVRRPRPGLLNERAPWLRIAAALALFLAGSASGALLRGVPGPSGEAPAAPVALAGAGAATTAEDASRELMSAEQLYLAALTRYAELTQADDPVDPVARLAALEGIVLTAQAALRESPADPVINGYLLAAVGQREAMLRQISRGSDEVWF